MGDLRDENGDVIQFVSTATQRLYGKFEIDGMGRYSVGGETLRGLVPDDIEAVTIVGDGPEYIFDVQVTVYEREKNQ